MELITEVSQKLKSAVKAKLSEIGVYVDEELPEYIMVLIANKKSKLQMDEHLSLFLGIHTQDFTTWLWDVLKKLESVTNLNAATGIIIKNADKKDNKKYIIKKADKASDLHAAPKKIRLSSKYINPLEQKVESASIEKFKAEMIDNQMNESPIEDDDDYLALREDYEIDDMLDSEMKDISKIQSKIQLKNKSVVQRNVASFPTENKKSLKTSIVSKDTSEATFIEPPKKICRPSSKIEVVYRSDTVHEKLETPGIASIVKVKARPTLPPGMQANKKLLLKAVAEAQQSVAGIHKKPKLQLYTRKYKQNIANIKDEKVSDIPVFFPYCSQSINGEINETNEKSITSSEINFVTSEQDKIEKRIVISQRCESPNFIVTLNGTNQINEIEMEPVLENKVSSLKKLERCRYWPLCKLSSECTFIHPNTPCKIFPNCKFGEKCFFVHPYCKFNGDCTKLNCPYTHNTPKLLLQPVNSKESLCKKFPYCTNMECRYIHPKPCKFGIKCIRPDCLFYHPHLPTREKLKWIASL